AVTCSAATASDREVKAVGPPGGPSIDSYALEPPALVLGNSTTIVVNASGGAPPLRYAYSGLPPGCASLNVSRLGCSPTTQGVYELTLTVEGANGSLASVMTNLTVHPAVGGGGLQITSFSGGRPVLPLGESTVISVTATNGRGPLSYTYSGLPPGCVSANSSSLNCTPTSNGTYRLYVLVQDPAGDRSGAFGTLQVTGSVAPSPSISLFSAAPRTFRLGAATVLFVSVDGGTPPFRYAYADLPTGCVGGDVPQLNCTPTATGHFPVVVSVTDARNRSANASLTIVVLPALAPSSGPGLFGGFGFGSLATLDGALAVAFVLAAALLFAGTEITVRRTRERIEGQELLRALAAARDPSGTDAGPSNSRDDPPH
ncbi:MAG TPA: hypothetical protein VMH90_01745, partial [Thermoplasmata archaeon]|nr:hypothetical protein [Thermoplasmata archaeon]